MQKLKRAFWIFGFLALASPAPAAFAKAPKDLSVDYVFVQGGPSKGATTEKYALQGRTLTLKTDYIPTQYGSDASKRIQDSKTFQVSDEQLQELWALIERHQFMSWPNTPAERPSESGNQTFTIQAGGKSATHGMWDAGRKDAFIQFSTDFLQWAKQVMRAQF